MSWPTRLPLIAILRGITPTEVLAHAEALLDAGFDAIEVPFNSPDCLQSIALLLEQFSQHATIGAGTVTTTEQIAQLVAINCRFIVTPNTNPAVIQAAAAQNMLSAIGCATITEAFSAIEAGASALKIFPAKQFGPGYIRALKAVLPPALPVFAVGGITPDNLGEYLAAGYLGAGLGGDLYQANQSVAQTASQAQAFVAAYQSAKP